MMAEQRREALGTPIATLAAESFATPLPTPPLATSASGEERKEEERKEEEKEEQPQAPPPRGRTKRKTKRKTEETQPQEKFVELATKLAWFATKMAVVKPLRATAPWAKACAFLTVEQLVRLVPERVVADVAVAAGSFAAKSAALVTESEEGAAAVGAVEQLVKDALDCACAEEGEAFVFESADAVAKFAKALKSKPALEFYDALERAVQAALKVAGSPLAAQVVADGRASADAAVELFGSDASLAAMDDAAHRIADALQTRRKNMGTRPQRGAAQSQGSGVVAFLRDCRAGARGQDDRRADQLDDTLSECGSDDENDDHLEDDDELEEEPPFSSSSSSSSSAAEGSRGAQPSRVVVGRVTRPPSTKKAKKKRTTTPAFALCAFVVVAAWCFFAAVGLLVIMQKKQHQTTLLEEDLFPAVFAPRPLKARSFDSPED